jgi:hypothetical protein
MEPHLSKFLAGLSVIGTALGPVPDVTVMTFILLGKYDKELAYAFYGQKHGIHIENVTEEEILTSPVAAIGTTNLKNWLRSILQQAINEESRMIEAQMRQNFQDLVAQQKEASKPHAQGTVAELAAKFGVSKSEIRRLKADGKLDEFIQEHIK